MSSNTHRESLGLTPSTFARCFSVPCLTSEVAVSSSWHFKIRHFTVAPQTMADALPSEQTSAPSAPRRARSGRPRGRGNNRAPANGRRRGHAPQNIAVNTQTRDAPSASAESGAAAPPAAPPNSEGNRGTREAIRARGTRGGPRRGRGGRHAQETHVAAARTFGGRLTSTVQDHATDQTTPALSAVDPAFVPGQALQPRPRKQAKAHDAPQPRQRKLGKSEAADLTSRIHDDIDNGQYECVICSGEVVRTSRIWSCSLCWTVTHFHCTNKWYTSQLKEGNQPQASEPNWRCPGCNSSLTEHPGSYHCWCGKELNPRSIPGVAPHSCGQTCFKPRGTCPHPCGLQCHSGPCPPCTLMGPVQSCYCGKITSQKRCIDTDYINGFSCKAACADLLPCGEHTCPQICHPGLCGACEVLVPSICYCGKEQKPIPCDQRDEVLDSYNQGQMEGGFPQDIPLDDNLLQGETVKSVRHWFQGSFVCQTPCTRKFDCGEHACQKGCHPHDEEVAHCPMSPDVVTHCPCEKTLLEEIMPEPRKKCTDKISHCLKACNKLLSCGHLCPDTCHVGKCQTCWQTTTITCRCGRTSAPTICHGVPPDEMVRPECPRTCRAVLNCGRHQCDTRCCPGDKRAAKRQAVRRRMGGPAHEEIEDEHLCTRTCNRILKCGKHFCEALCHKGPCPSCLESIVEEISCSCGRTTLFPPQPVCSSALDA